MPGLKYCSFRIHYYHHCPILDVSVSISSLYQSPPILFWTIIMLSSRWHPSLHHLHNALLPAFRTLLGQVLVEQIFSLESIHDVALLCFWPLSVRRQIDDPSWNYCGHMTNVALTMGLNKVQVDSNDPKFNIKRKTWFTIVYANCSHGWKSGIVVSPEVLNSWGTSALPACSIVEKQFCTNVDILRKVVKHSSLIINLRPDMDSWSFVQGLCSELDSLRDGPRDGWTIEIDIIVLGAQLCFYAFQISRGKKILDSTNGLNTFIDHDSITSRRNFTTLAYMAAAKLIDQFSEMVQLAPESSDTSQPPSPAPQRHLPKHYFTLLLTSVGFHI